MKAEYVRIVSINVRLRPSTSPMRPKNAPPIAHPNKKAAWMSEAFVETSGVDELMCINSATNGNATSV